MSRDPLEFLPLTHVVYHTLLAVSGAACHGYGIIKAVEERTGGRVVLEAGTLYAAIKRLREDGLIEDRPTPAEEDQRRRYYGLSPLGRSVLQAESRRMQELVALAREARVLGPGG